MGARDPKREVLRREQGGGRRKEKQWRNARRKRSEGREEVRSRIGRVGRAGEGVREAGEGGGDEEEEEERGREKVSGRSGSSRRGVESV